MQTTEKYGAREALKQYFGFEGFLDHQEEIVSAMLSGRDLCVIMPTGAGKSLCYQLPLLLRPGYGIVVSPLISLMKDQVDALIEKQIPAAFINSTVSFGEQCRIVDRAAAGELKLLYVAPERFQTDFFRNFILHTPPSTMVIDEAHCISQWGHDFRPSYWRLGEVIDQFNIPQVCAFTATATPHVREDIRTQLHRPGMELCVAGFKRPNLSFQVVNCSSDASKFAAIRKLLARKCPTIIYASTRKGVEQLVEEFGVIGYHAGMPDADRTEAQDRFMNDPCPVLAATNAFGMGIDRPDVRQVIHFNLPGSLEAYYQEAGRAGRDGEAADCILLYAYRDRYVQEFLIDLSNPPPEVVQQLYRELRRTAVERKSRVIEVTLGELLPGVEDAKSENQLSAAMGILEKAGMIARGYRQSSRGVMQFTGDLEELRLLNQLENTQRSRFVSRVVKHYGAQLRQPGNYTVEELANVAGLNPEQTRRVLNALNGECLSWNIPFSGRSTELLHPELAEVELDYEAMNRKREFELNRLGEVISYATARKCRQACLISYFGESTDGWSCGSCDNCRETGLAVRRAPSAGEEEIIQVILGCIGDFDGRFGAGKISQILAGARSAELVNRNLHHSRWFGALSQLRQNQVMKYIKSREGCRCIGRIERGDYPCLELAPHGMEVLAGHARAELDVPEEPIRGRRRRESPDTSAIRRTETRVARMEHHALYDALKAVRARLAEQRGVPAFQVLSNAALAEFAERQPLTVQEAMEINGIGPVKAATVVPLFLEAIRLWRAAEREARDG